MWKLIDDFKFDHRYALKKKTLNAIVNKIEM